MMVDPTITKEYLVVEAQREQQVMEEWELRKREREETQK